MERKEFAKIVQEVLDSLPEEFRERIRNVAVLLEDFPSVQLSTAFDHPKKLLLGLFHGVPMTKKSVFALPTGPDYVVLYQKNIEAVCSTQAEIREQIRRTVIHEFGHYFGMDEEQLKDVYWTGVVSVIAAAFAALCFNIAPPGSSAAVGKTLPSLALPTPNVDDSVYSLRRTSTVTRRYPFGCHTGQRHARKRESSINRSLVSPSRHGSEVEKQES